MNQLHYCLVSGHLADFQRTQVLLPHDIFGGPSGPHLDDRDAIHRFLWPERAAGNLAGDETQPEVAHIARGIFTHDPHAASYADNVLFLADGQIIDEMPNPTTDAVLDRMKQQGYIVDYTLGPRSGKGEVSTRVRIAKTQTVYAVAMMADGTRWGTSVELQVTFGACVDEVLDFEMREFMKVQRLRGRE